MNFLIENQKYILIAKLISQPNDQKMQTLPKAQE
jgi:hypothetical protein